MAVIVMSITKLVASVVAGDYLFKNKTGSSDAMWVSDEDVVVVVCFHAD